MDIDEAIRGRWSTRAFRPDPVPEQTLREIMELALRAPSWGNTQPWEFAIVTGNKLEEIRQDVIARAEEMPTPDIPMPREFPEPYGGRRRALGIRLFQIEGIAREDWEKRRQWVLRGLRLFEAPAVIYIYVDRLMYFQGDRLNVWPLFDCGMVAQNIVLLATSRGLGSIPQIQAVHYPDVLRKALGIPESKLIMLGIAIGYPDRDHLLNRFRSEREPLDRVSIWAGFE